MEQNGYKKTTVPDLRVPTCSADGRLKHELDSGIRSSHRILEVSVYSRAIRSLSGRYSPHHFFIFPLLKSLPQKTWANPPMHLK
jgi:hypothetical protein